VLRQIGELCRDGHSMRGIAGALNRRAMRTRRGSMWRLESVARIVKQGIAILREPESRR
jgi:hypothetical protein